jgi:hypothetical protein
VRPVAVLATGLLLVVPMRARADQVADDEKPTARVPRSSATAQQPTPTRWEPPPEPKHTAIYYVFGAGTPVGAAGFEAVHRFGSTVFELSAGIGAGFSAGMSTPNPPFGHSVQWSVMPRLRLGAGGNAFTAGAGISGGNYGGIHLTIGDGPGPNAPYPTDYVLWANFEAGGECWYDSGFALRYFLGLASGCAVSGCGSSTGFPYLGLGLGYAW